MSQETLYELLQEATDKSESDSYNSERLQQLAEEVLSAGPRMELTEAREELRKKELDLVKKTFIERSADKRQSVADVVDGNATFYSYGEPILDHIRNVEERYQNFKLVFVPKGELLGKDRSYSTSENAKEAVQYLTEQQIIDPGEFFSFRLIHPAAGIVSKMDEKNPILNMRTLALTGLVTAPIGASLGYQIGGEMGVIPGGLGGLALPMISVCGICSLGEGIDGISKQRESFEKALRSLDSDVRKYFPLEAKNE